MEPKKDTDRSSDARRCSAADGPQLPVTPERSADAGIVLAMIAINDLELEIEAELMGERSNSRNAHYMRGQQDACASIRRGLLQLAKNNPIRTGH